MAGRTEVEAVVGRHMALPYRIELVPASEGGFAAYVPDLPGCISQGDDIADTYSMIRDAMREWMFAQIERGRTIPEPNAYGGFSGHLSVRMPRTLHRRLSEEAQREGVSLNQWIVYKLSTPTGADHELAVTMETRR